MQFSMCFIQFYHVFHLFFRAGGPWLITDLDRIESIFVINPNLQVIYNVFLLAGIIVATIIVICTYQYCDFSGVEIFL